MIVAWRDGEGRLADVPIGNNIAEDMKEKDERRWEIIIRNWNLREFHVGVNLPFPIWQVWHLILSVLTPGRYLQNTIRPVVPLLSHFHSYLPYHSHFDIPSHFLIHNSTIIAAHNGESSRFNSPSYGHEVIQSQPYPDYSIHQVLQDLPQLVSSLFILTNISYPLNVASASDTHPYKINHQQPALFESWVAKSVWYIPTVVS